MFRELKNKFVNDMADKIAARLGLSAPQNAKRPLSLGYGSSFLPKTLSSSEAQSLLAYSFQKPVQSISFKTVAVPGKGYAQDALGEAIKAPALYGLEGFQQDIIFTFFAKYGFIGYQACSLLQQHWLINNACTIPNEDALRPGWKTTLTGGKDNADLLQDLSRAENKKYDIYAKALKWGRNRKIFGLALAYPVIDGVDTEKPFNIDGVKPGSFKGIAVIDPYWCMPEFDADTVRNPLDPDYFKPAYYVFNGRRVHRSHLLIWLNDEPSDILKPSYIYGGIPLTQQIYERVYAAEKSANEAPEILLTKRSTIAKSTDMDNALAQESETARKLGWMRKLLNNFGILLTDYDVHQLDTTLTGLCEIIDNQYKLVAAVAKIPEHKLMKTNPSGGLGNKGEFSTKDYRLEVCSLQEYGYKPFIERIEDIILRSEFGVKTQTDITFNELDLTDQTEKAALLTQKTQNLGTLIDKGMISPDEGRKSLIEDENSGFAWLPEDAPEALITPEQEEELKALASGKDKDGGNSSPSSQGKSQAEDEWDEKKHPRGKDGKFAVAGEFESSSQGKNILSKILAIQPVKIRVKIDQKTALSALEKLTGKNLTNEETGIKAQINNRQRNKIISERAVSKSINNGFTREEHYAAAEQIDLLYKKSIKVKERPDKKNNDVNIKSIKEFIAPFMSEGENRIGYAHLLLKETEEYGHKIYTLELQKLEKVKKIIDFLL
ncbi:MAG: anti-CBASS protein Acb1 family protein [Elusimicrobiaceae bacterium]